MLVVIILTIISTYAPYNCHAGYNLVDSYSGNNFFSQFKFETGGYGGYSWMVNQSYAEQLNIAKVQNNQVYIGVDTSMIIEPGYPGRPSINIRSNTVYNGGLFITSLQHMPVGCGTQPQFWLDGLRYPTNGQIMWLTNSNLGNGSISAAIAGGGYCNFTGVNDNNFTGSWGYTQDCHGNGCPIDDTNCSVHIGNSYNVVKGGYHALQWIQSSNGGVYAWFWGRDDPDIPSDIKSNSKTPDPSTFGEPFAAWPFGKWCNYSFIVNQTIQIDTQLCGYAGLGNCPSQYNPTNTTSCKGYVANNPKEFTETYWLFDYINVYQQT
eukprot:331812_1